MSSNEIFVILQRFLGTIFCWGVQKLNTLYNYVMFQASEDWTNASVSRVNISFDKYLVSFFKYMVNHLIMKGNGIIDLFMISVMLNSTPSKNTDKYDKTLPQAYIKIYSYKNWRSLKIIRRLKQILSHDKSQFFFSVRWVVWSIAYFLPELFNFLLSMVDLTSFYGQFCAHWHDFMLPGGILSMSTN